MPIADCFVASASGEADPEAVVRAWSAHSGVAADEMTVNIVYGRRRSPRSCAYRCRRFRC